MRVVAVPLPAENVDAWRAFGRELMGARRAEFERFNARLGLTSHRAYLQRSPDGVFVIATHEGPGEDRFLAEAFGDDDDFGRWFSRRLPELHGIDFENAPPPAVELVIDAAGR